MTGTAKTMKAVDVPNGAGPASALFINSSIPKPSPLGCQCLVHIKAFGLNRADTLQRQGGYPPPPGVTHIMGLEFAGVVEEVGSDESTSDERHHWKTGDEVFGLAYGGAYAEYIAISKRMLLRKPAELSWEVCAGAPETWMTALQALHLVGEFDPARTKSVLWHAGASSVSIAGIQLSLAAGASEGTQPSTKVLATARQDSKCEFITSKVGAHAAVNTTAHSGTGWVDEIKRVNGGNGVDLIIDYTGAGYFAGNLDVMALDGKMVILALLGGSKLPPNTDISQILRKRLRIEGSTLRSRAPEYQERLRDLFEEKVLPNLLSGKFENHVDTVLDWSKIGEAHDALEQNRTMGKIVCTVPWN